MILVRNPSYDPATDGLRPAYPDRIETTIGGDTADLYNKVETGDVDYVVDAHPPANVLQEYSTNPDKQPYLHTYPTNGNYYISMNLGVPPFDDIHVRKALNWVIRQGGEHPAVRRCVDRFRRRTHLSRRTHQQRAEGL